ncbi:MAG: hypothetical protein ACKOEU_00450, partial [Limnohabitans sp.]
HFAVAVPDSSEGCYVMKNCACIRKLRRHSLLSLSKANAVGVVAYGVVTTCIDWAVAGGVELNF